MNIFIKIFCLIIIGVILISCVPDPESIPEDLDISDYCKQEYGDLKTGYSIFDIFSDISQEELLEQMNGYNLGISFNKNYYVELRCDWEGEEFFGIAYFSDPEPS